MNRTQQINEQLYNKLSKEYDTFIKKLKTLPPDEIIRSSYEKVFKEDILMCFECGDMDYDKAKALLKHDKPLEELYQGWMDTDASYMDMLRDSINDRANAVIKDMKVNNKAMER